MRTHLKIQYAWQQIVSMTAGLVGCAVIAFALGGCGSDSASTATTDPTVPTVAAPGVPTNFTVIRTPEVTLSATLGWSPPTSGGTPVTFEIYRSTTAGTAFSPDNHLISIPVVAGQATYTFIDNAGLTAVNTYWVVSAKNAGGETPTAEVMYKPIGPPGGGGGGDAGFGNNFAAALIFADDIGIGGALITGDWTTDPALIDYNTGLRPLLGEIANLAALTPPVLVTTLPYLDPLTTYLLGGVTYYKQQTASTWQGPWVRGAGAMQQVTAKWGDNLVSQKLTASSSIRIEMVLSNTLATAVKSYTMKSLYGTRENEIYGTDGTTYDNLTAFVFASNARLTIQKLDGATNPVLVDLPLWKVADGPGNLAGEVNVGGNFTYGYVWKLNSLTLPPTIPSKTGTWRLTFTLDPDNTLAGDPPGSKPFSVNHTEIVTAANGVRVNAQQVYIDITVQ